MPGTRGSSIHGNSSTPHGSAARVVDDPTVMCRLLGRASRDRDVEVQHIFANAEFRVKRNRRVIAVIGLHEDHVDTALPRNVSQGLNQRGGDALTTLACHDGQVII